MRAEVRDHLADDTTLMALLTGGVYTGTEISRQNTPDAFDTNGEIIPCALVTEESDTQAGPFTESGNISTRLFVAVFFYQRVGYDTIDAAMERTLELLQRAKLATGTWEIAWADDVRGQRDEALRCSMGMSRYVATRKRG